MFFFFSNYSNFSMLVLYTRCDKKFEPIKYLDKYILDRKVKKKKKNCIKFFKKTICRCENWQLLALSRKWMEGKFKISNGKACLVTYLWKGLLRRKFWQKYFWKGDINYKVRQKVYSLTCISEMRNNSGKLWKKCSVNLIDRDWVKKILRMDDIIITGDFRGLQH